MGVSEDEACGVAGVDAFLSSDARRRNLSVAGDSGLGEPIMLWKKLMLRA